MATNAHDNPRWWRVTAAVTLASAALIVALQPNLLFAMDRWEPVVAAVLVGLPLFAACAARGRDATAHRYALAGSLVALLPFVLLAFHAVVAYSRIGERGDGYVVAVVWSAALPAALVVCASVAAEVSRQLAGGRRLGDARRVERVTVAALSALAALVMLALRGTAFAPSVAGAASGWRPVGVLPPLRSGGAAGDGAARLSQWRRVGGVDVVRWPEYLNHCGMSLGRVPSEDRTKRTIRLPCAAPVSVLEDARLGVLIFAPERDIRAVVRRADGRFINLSARDLAPWSAPPQTWTLCGAAGLVLAVVFMLRGRRASRELARWAEARAGTLATDGTVTLADGGPALRVRGRIDIDHGPVLVLAVVGAAPFRDDPRVDAAHVRGGTALDLRDAVHRERGGWYALSIATGLWSSAPLVVAAANGLVG